MAIWIDLLLTLSVVITVHTIIYVWLHVREKLATRRLMKQQMAQYFGSGGTQHRMNPAAGGSSDSPNSRMMAMMKMAPT